MVLPSAAIGPMGIVIGQCVRPSVRLFVRLFVRLSIHPKRHSHSYSLTISAVSLKFGGMMHSTMEQTAI